MTVNSFPTDLVYTHMDLNTQIHFTGLFLPWHRWFLYAVEDALKSKCGFNGVSPYWNWSIGPLLSSSLILSAHHSQMHLTFTNRRSGRTQIPKVDSAAGEIQTLTTALPMEASASSNCRIPPLISYAATSHSDHSTSRSWCLTIPHWKPTKHS